MEGSGHRLNRSEELFFGVKKCFLFNVSILVTVHGLRPLHLFFLQDVELLSLRKQFLTQ